MPSSDRLATQFHELLTPTLQGLSEEQVIDRLWAKDHRLWKTEPTEISNRLGWLTLPSEMRTQQDQLDQCATAAKAAGIKDVVLLGMGGSSLGPEVFRTSFGSTRGYPRLWVLDSTVPRWIRQVTERINPAKTLFLVASKSGGTIEVMALFAYFWDLVGKTKGTRGGKHFIAITDPGTGLEHMAKEYGYQQIFANPPDIGGRYSVLSLFGLVPAALTGVDADRLLERASTMADRCHSQAPIENPGAYLGAAMGTLAKAGRDKVTIIASPSISTFGLWAEQLLAESTGKEGTGLIPVAQEPVMVPNAYGADRVFIYLRLNGDANQGLDRHVRALAGFGQPVLQFDLQDRYDLGSEFFRWEFATAVAGHILKIHPFDQPNVQESKDNTARVLAAVQSTGRLPEEPTVHLREAALELTKHFRAGSYMAILAYTTPSRKLEAAIDKLRRILISHYHIATTCGYGPRYLHSTGQLHKGGPNSGMFIELVDRMKPDLAIPGKAFSFGTLARAQATGDLESLGAHGRVPVRIQLGQDPVATVNALAAAFASARPPRREITVTKRRRKTSRR